MRPDGPSAQIPSNTKTAWGTLALMASIQGCHAAADTLQPRRALGTEECEEDQKPLLARHLVDADRGHGTEIPVRKAAGNGLSYGLSNRAQGPPRQARDVSPG
ncbi:MAG: hypothetical protein ACREBC_08940 [Pyrinomonadaceae bacterium]